MSICQESKKGASFQVGFQVHLFPILGLVVRIIIPRIAIGNRLLAPHWVTRSSAALQQNLTKPTALKGWIIACDVQAFQIQGTFGSNASGGSSEASQIQEGKEVK